MDRGAWRASVHRLVRTHTPIRTDRILVKQFFLDFLNIKTQVSITFLCFHFSIVIHYPKASGWLYSPPLLWEFEKFKNKSSRFIYTSENKCRIFKREKNIRQMGWFNFHGDIMSSSFAHCNLKLKKTHWINGMIIFLAIKDGLLELYALYIKFLFNIKFQKNLEKIHVETIWPTL